MKMGKKNKGGGWARRALRHEGGGAAVSKKFNRGPYWGTEDLPASMPSHWDGEKKKKVFLVGRIFHWLGPCLGWSVYHRSGAG